MASTPRWRSGRRSRWTLGVLAVGLAAWGEAAPTGETAAAQVRAQAPTAAEEEVWFATTAAQPVRAHPRGPWQQALEPLLVQQARALVAALQPWDRDPRAAHLATPNRPPSGEHGLRPGAHAAKGLALMVRLLPDAAWPTDFTREQARTAALALVRYLGRTYGTDGDVCADGKPWRGQWQSAYWASLAGEAAWLLWDELTPTERRLAARMVADEADRFVVATPPAAVRLDSKAEENAWNSIVLSLAANQFPRHPRREAWHRAAVRWIASSFATASDTRSEECVDGRPLRDWVAGANLHDDFTLENHRRVHPDYMACTYLLTAQVPLYAWGGRPVPAAIHRHVKDIGAVLQRLGLPDGGVLYPNGQDWGLRRQIDWFEYHATAAVLYGDARAAGLAQAALATVQRMAARQPSGGIYRPEETKLSSDAAMMLEYPAHVYALLAQCGEGPAPLPPAALAQALRGGAVYPNGKYLIYRTPTSLAAFSWGAQVLGQVVPLREDLLLAPETRSLVGHVTWPGLAREAPELRQADVVATAGGLGVVWRAQRAGGRIEQRGAFFALADGRVVYADRLTWADASAAPLSAAPVEVRCDLGTLGVLNDLAWPAHRGARTVLHAGGRHTFAAADASVAASVDFSTPWLNLDDALGIVRFAAAGPARYVPVPTGATGRREQRLHLAVTTARGPAPAAGTGGAPLAYGVYVFYPGQSAVHTAAAAARGQLRSEPGATPIVLVLEDGTRLDLDLTAPRLTVAPARR